MEQSTKSSNLLPSANDDLTYSKNYHKIVYRRTQDISHKNREEKVKRLEKWLRKEVKFSELPRLLMSFVAINFGYSLIMAIILMKTGLLKTIDTEAYDELFDTPFHPSILVLFMFAACLEETAFRLPLAIAVKKKWSGKQLLILAIISSIIFGSLHASWICIFIQGIFGLTISGLFLKCGGYQKKFFTALGIVISTHFFYDLSLYLLYRAGA